MQVVIPGCRPNRSGGGARLARALVTAAGVFPSLLHSGAALAAAGEAAGQATATEEPKPVRFELETGDRVRFAAWHYPVPDGGTPLATVILLHNLGGSHATIDPLARGLQAAGCGVVVPDLRGHGESVDPRLERASGSRAPSELLKLQDFRGIIATGGGRVRDQAQVRGEIEAVRNWIKERSGAESGLSLDRLYLVGSGLGAALAAHWTNADAAWPPITSGPQGGHVKGVVFVEPTFAEKGFQILPALGQEPLKTQVPVMVIAGKGCRDADKVFEPLKRWRAEQWFDSRTPRGSPAKDSEATLVFAELEGKDGKGAVLRGDQLASLRSPDRNRPDPAFLITAFIKATTARRP